VPVHVRCNLAPWYFCLEFLALLSANRSTQLPAVEDNWLIDELFHLFVGLIGIAGAFAGLRWLRGKSTGGAVREHETPSPEPVFEITPAEWSALQGSPGEELLRRLYARPLAVYRIADLLGAGPARTFDAFCEQVARLPKRRQDDRSKA
jgi:hypothetical protein